MSWIESLWISYCIAQHLSGHPSNFFRNCSSCPKLSSNFNSGLNPLSFQLNQMHMHMLCGELFLYIIPFLCIGVVVQMTLSLMLLICVIIVREPVLRKNNNDQNQPARGEGSEGEGNYGKSSDEKMRQKVRRQSWEDWNKQKRRQGITRKENRTLNEKVKNRVLSQIKPHKDIVMTGEKH